MITLSSIRIFHILSVLSIAYSSFLDLSKRKQFELGVPIDVLRSDICQFVDWAQSQRDSLSDSNRKALGKLKVFYLSEIEKCLNKKRGASSIKGMCSQPLNNPRAGLLHSCIGKSAFDVAEITDSFQQKGKPNSSNKILVLTASEADALTPNPREKIVSPAHPSLQQSYMPVPFGANSAAGLVRYDHKKRPPVSVVRQTLTKTILKVKYPATLTQTLTRSIIIPVQKPPEVQTILKPIFRYFTRNIPIITSIPYAEPVFITKKVVVPSISTVFLPVFPNDSTVSSDAKRKVLQRMPNNMEYYQTCGVGVQCRVPGAVYEMKPSFYTPTNTVSTITTVTQIVLQSSEAKKSTATRDMLTTINVSARNRGVDDEIERIMGNLSKIQQSISTLSPVTSYINTSISSTKNTSIVTRRITIYRKNSAKDKTVTIDLDRIHPLIANASPPVLHTVYSTVAVNQNNGCQLCEDDNSGVNPVTSTPPPISSPPLAVDNLPSIRGNTGGLDRVDKPKTITITSRITVTVTRDVRSAEADQMPDKAFRTATSEPSSVVSIPKRADESVGKPIPIEGLGSKSTSLATADRILVDSETMGRAIVNSDGVNNPSLIKRLNELERSLKESNELNKQLVEKVIEALRIDREMHSIIVPKQVTSSFSSPLPILPSAHSSSSTLAVPGSKQDTSRKTGANPLAEILNLLSGNDQQSYLVETSPANTISSNSTTTLTRNAVEEHPNYKDELLNELMAFITKDSRSDDDVVRVLNLIRLVKQYNKAEISMSQSDASPMHAVESAKRPSKSEKSLDQANFQGLQNNSSVPAVKVISEINRDEKDFNQTSLSTPAVKMVTILVNNEESIEPRLSQGVIQSIPNNTSNTPSNEDGSTSIRQNIDDSATLKSSYSASSNSASTKTLIVSHTLTVTTTVQKRDQAITSTVIQPVVSIKPEIRRETKTLVRTVTVFRNSQTPLKRNGKVNTSNRQPPGLQSAKAIGGRSYVLSTAKTLNNVNDSSTKRQDIASDKTITHQDLNDKADNKSRDPSESIHNQDGGNNLEHEVKDAKVVESNQKYKIIEIRETKEPGNGSSDGAVSGNAGNKSNPDRYAKKKIKSAELTLENLVGDNPKIINIDLPVEQISEVLKQIPDK